MCQNEVCPREICDCEICQCNVLNVEVKKKTPRHPFYGKGSDKGYVINGVEGAELELKVGEKYLIKYQISQFGQNRRFYNNPEHPFYISTGPYGKGEGRLSEDITKPTTISFDRPGTFYYACSKHPYMGGVIFVYE